MGNKHRIFFACALCALTASSSIAQDAPFTARDVFELEVARDPQVSPDGRRVAYIRSGFDAMTDGSRTSLWVVGTDGSGARPLTDGTYGVSQPRWSPDGTRIAYVAAKGGRGQLFVRWMDTGDSVELTDMERAPSGIAWSPDGMSIAFVVFVPDPTPIVSPTLPAMPEGADWGPAWKVIDEMDYRSDGAGYLKEGYRHLFVLSADGGTPTQVTEGSYNHDAPVWSADGTALIVSANRNDDREHEQNNSDVHRIDVATHAVTKLTDRFGPDGSPAVATDGRIAYVGFDDRYQGHQGSRLYVMGADGSGKRQLVPDFDRDISSPQWSADGRRLYFGFDDEGIGRIAYVTADGAMTRLDAEVGGLSIGRPYSGGQFDAGAGGVVAYTTGTPERPADLAVVRDRSTPLMLTSLNEDLLGHRSLATVETRWYRSSYDDRPIEAWVAKPAGFDPARKYPLILEIHGGPFSAYGPHFAAEIQLYAAAGYVVVYANPRGSTSYGEEFANLIHHAYPGYDYDDLMSVVDGVVAEGYVDSEQLFVTGGSGGGVLSAWIVGKTDRFRAAVVVKPVINWYSFVLYADGPAFFYRYWFPGPPWEHEEEYMRRSPISLVGNVKTPTMLMTGEVDYRTPSGEAEQFYAALKIRGIDAALVRVPDASHGIANKPINLAAKAAHVLAWFERYRK